METTLYLSEPERQRVRSWGESGYPLETCGLLVGRQENGEIRVSYVTSARNLNSERAHDRYELSAEDFLRTDREARAAGLEILGVWHTHPDQPARPSETDRRQAWPEWSYVILSIEAGRLVDLRSWRLSDKQFIEEEIRKWQP
jgi:proteasome lid subunit RPN8/RPN11